MRTRQFGIAVFVLGALAAAPAWGSVERAGKLQLLPAASSSPVAAQHDQLPLWAAPATNPFEVKLVAFADQKDDDKAKPRDDDKDKGKKPPPPPPPPERSEKCPPGHGGDDNGHGNDGHDCRGDR
jgi:hypothetical protein